MPQEKMLCNINKMPRTVNNYPNASAMYANSKWTYSAPVMRNVVVLFNANKSPFYIKNGKRQSFTRKTNNNGENRLFFGTGPYNYLMNTPANAKNVFGKYKKAGWLQKRRPVLNSLAVAQVRLAKKAAANKKAAAKRAVNNASVNKLRNNVLAGRNISKAKLANLLHLVMRYQSPDAGAYYHSNNRGRVTNNNGKKPTRKQLLNNINNFREYNFFNN
jgi:hypothetical protein